MKKFTDARICRRHEAASEILVDRGVVTQIGTERPGADEELDPRGHLVVPPYKGIEVLAQAVGNRRREGAGDATIGRTADGALPRAMSGPAATPARGAA